MSDDSRGRFCWHDLITTDLEAAKAFYTRVVGWGTTVWDGGGGGSYTMWTRGADAVPLGGIGKLSDEARAAGAPPHWLAYVSSPDLDAAALWVSDQGGQVRVPPTDIPTVGRYAIFADPQGATFAGFTGANSTPGSDGAPEVGEFSWHELATTDPEAAFAFYAELFGWEKRNSFDMGEMGSYQIYGREGRDLGGIFHKPKEMPGPPSWLHYARVLDVKAAAETVKAAGGQVMNGPMEVPGGSWIVQGMDPQGGMFALHHTAPGG